MSQRAWAGWVAAGTLAMAAGAPAAVNTRIDWQVSGDGLNWSSSGAFSPGQLVQVRALVTYTGTDSPLGLAVLVFQPTVSNWSATSQLAPLETNMVPDMPERFGRVSPWGRSALTPTSFLRGHTHMNPVGDGLNYLRIAQNQATSWLGGPGNTTGGAGVPISQLNNVGRTSSDPAFAAQLSDIVVFKFGIVAGGSTGTMVVDSLFSLPHPQPGGGEREVYWFASMTETTGSIRGTPIITPATIVIPAPSAAVLLVCGLACSGHVRRRR